MFKKTLNQFLSHNIRNDENSRLCFIGVGRFRILGGQGLDIGGGGKV